MAKIIKGFSIDPHLETALKKEAKARDRSVSYLVNEAITQYLGEKANKPKKKLMKRASQ